MEQETPLWTRGQIGRGLGFGLGGIILLGVGMALVLRSGIRPVSAFLLLGGAVELLLLTIALVSARRLPGGPWRTLGLGNPLTGEGVALALLAFMGSLLFAGGYIFLMAHLGITPRTTPAPVLALTGPERVGMVLLAAGVAPLAEEAFYRGFLFQGMRHLWGTGRALLVSSALFSLSHGLPFLFLPAFVAGLLFSLLLLKTRSLWAPVLAHTLQNGLVALLVF